jgi:hypothetical protein
VTKRKSDESAKLPDRVNLISVLGTMRFSDFFADQGKPSTRDLGLRKRSVQRPISRQPELLTFSLVY